MSPEQNRARHNEAHRGYQQRRREVLYQIQKYKASLTAYGDLPHYDETKRNKVESIDDLGHQLDRLELRLKNLLVGRLSQYHTEYLKELSPAKLEQIYKKIMLGTVIA